MKQLHTIGYEKSPLEDFIQTLRDANIAVLVDVRERAQSRRKGFSKTALAEALNSNGIEYIHLRALGDPKPGRDAARSGDYGTFRRIYKKVLSSKGALEALETIETLLKSERACLMCYERDHENCHRSMVAEKVVGGTKRKIRHLTVGTSDGRKTGRMLYRREGAAAPIQPVL